MAGIARILRRLFGLRSYDAAKSSGRGQVFGNVGGTDLGPNVELQYAGQILRNRSREAYRNNATARAAVEAFVAHVVGTGMDVEPASGDEARDDKMREVWAEWLQGASVCGRFSLWELQRQAMRTVMLGGDVLWQIVAVDDGRTIPFAILPIESDRLSDEAVEPIPSDRRFVQGVEIDRLGRPVAYHVTAEDSASITYGMGIAGNATLMGATLRDPQFGAGSKGKGVRIPAEDIIHAFEPLRPGQVRGEPMLAPVLTRIAQEGQLIDAELTAARTGAAVAVAIISESAAGIGGTATTETDGNGYAVVDLSPGSIARLRPGEDIKTVRNERPSQQVAPFSTFIRGGIAAALRITATDLDKNYANANYSSMRAAQLDLRRQIEPIQEHFGRLLAVEVYRRLGQYFAMAAGLSLPSGGPGRRKALACTLHPDGFPYVDPQKDIAAAKDAIEANLSSYTDEVQRRGGDLRGMWTRLAADKAMAKGMGIDLTVKSDGFPPRSGIPSKPEAESEPKPKAD